MDPEDLSPENEIEPDHESHAFHVSEEILGRNRLAEIADDFESLCDAASD